LSFALKKSIADGFAIAYDSNEEGNSASSAVEFA
jgi:hypothetical protein